MGRDGSRQGTSTNGEGIRSVLPNCFELTSLLTTADKGVEFGLRDCHEPCDHEQVFFRKSYQIYLAHLTHEAFSLGRQPQPRMASWVALQVSADALGMPGRERGCGGPGR